MRTQNKKKLKQISMFNGQASERTFKYWNLISFPFVQRFFLTLWVRNHVNRFSQMKSLTIVNLWDKTTKRRGNRWRCCPVDSRWALALLVLWVIKKLFVFLLLLFHFWKCQRLHKKQNIDQSFSVKNFESFYDCSSGVFECDVKREIFKNQRWIKWLSVVSRGLTGFFFVWG